MLFSHKMRKKILIEYQEKFSGLLNKFHVKELQNNGPLQCQWDTAKIIMYPGKIPLTYTSCKYASITKTFTRSLFTFLPDLPHPMGTNCLLTFLNKLLLVSTHFSSGSYILWCITSPLGGWVVIDSGLSTFSMAFF